MAVQSTYNVVVPLVGVPLEQSTDREGPYYALFNSLAGSIDVIDQPVLEGLDLTSPLREDVGEYLSRRGYLFASAEEERGQTRLLYEEMLRLHRATASQPIVVVPSYNCNLKCPYCWQRLHHLDSPVISREMVDHLFAVALPALIETSSPDRVALTVFGGEPLQEDPALQDRVVQILALGKAAGYTNGVITNGVGLGKALPRIADKVDVLQVTFDGPPQVHRKRRPLPGGDSFAPLAAAVSDALAAGVLVRARVNVDASTIEHLPELSDFARNAGWLDNPRMFFHIVPVKNHNPRHCAPPESELLLKVLDLADRDERMRAFDLSGFAGIKYFRGFQESGLFSLHRFFNCEAQINSWVLDLYGDLYACWDSAGLKHLAVGRFHPEVEIDPLALGRWRNRNALGIPACQQCAAAPHCGGGCQFIAYEHHGDHAAPACDSLLASYVQAIGRSAGWLLERARAGDHAVGLITRDGVVTAVNRPFGLLDESPELIDAIRC